MDLSQHFPSCRQSCPDPSAGGQPEPPTWPTLAEAGVCMVIDLRSTMDISEHNEAEEVHSAGLTCVNVTIEGADRIGREAAAARWLAQRSCQIDADHSSRSLRTEPWPI